MQDLTGQLRRRDEHAAALESAREQAETLCGESDANHHQLMQEHRSLLDTRQQDVIRIALYRFLLRKAAYCRRGWQDKTKAALLLRRAFANTVARMKLLFSARAFDSWQSAVRAQRHQWRGSGPRPSATARSWVTPGVPTWAPARLTHPAAAAAVPALRCVDNPHRTRHRARRRHPL